MKLPEEYSIKNFDHHPSYITPQQQEEIRSTLHQNLSGAVIVRAAGRRSFRDYSAVQSAPVRSMCHIAEIKVAAINAHGKLDGVADSPALNLSNTS